MSGFGRARLAVALAGGVILFQAVGLLAAGPATWGFDHLAFVPGPFAWGLLAAAVVFWLPPVSGALAGRIDAWVVSLGTPRAARTAAAIVIALSVAAFWFGRVREFFLSDSRLLMMGIDEGARHFAADAMAMRLQAFVHQIFAAIPSVSASFRVVSMAAGVLWLGALLTAIGLITRDGRQRAMLAALVIPMGLTKLFYGYPETSPLLAAAVALVVLAGVRAVRSGAGEWALAGACVVAGLMHLTGLLVLPAMAFILVPRWRQRMSARLVLVAAPLVIGVVYAAALVARGPSAGVDPWGAYWSEFIPLAGPLHAKQAYTLLSWQHLVAVLNEMILLGPFVLAGFVVLVALSRRGRAFVTGRPVEAFLAALLLPFLALSLVFNRKLGAARDWDLVASVAVPSTLLFGLWLVEGAVREKGGWLTRAALVLFVAGVLHLAGWVLVDADPGRSLARAEALAAEGAAVSPFARSYALEEVGAAYLAAGRTAEARAVYERAVRADPANAKATGSLGAIYGSEGRNDDALALFRETVRLRPDLDLAHFNLGNALARRGEFAAAEQSYRQTLHLEPDNGLAWLYLGSVQKRQGKREEARQSWRDGLRHADPPTAARINEALAAVD